MIAARSPSTECLVQQFEVDDLGGFHEETVGKRTAAGAGDLITEQLDSAVEDTVIVWLKNAHFTVVEETNREFSAELRERARQMSGR